MDKKGIQVYVYALLEDSGRVCYIGKSSQPKRRLVLHRNQGYPHISKIEILDIFYDTENYWIHKFLKEGQKVDNKEISETVEYHNIGDIVTVSEKISTRVKNKKTGIVYESMYKASEELGIPYDTVRLLVNIKPTSRMKTKELYRDYPLVVEN